MANEHDGDDDQWLQGLRDALASPATTVRPATVEASDQAEPPSVALPVVQPADNPSALADEIHGLEVTVAELAERVGDLHAIVLAREPLETEHIDRLADAADEVRRQLADASEAGSSFESTVEKLLGHGTDVGKDVAWTDVMFLTHELRSRVDDLAEQQHRHVRDLNDWRTDVDDRLDVLRSELLREVRRVGERP